MQNRRIIRDLHCIANKLSRQLDGLLAKEGITNAQFAMLQFIKDHSREDNPVFQKDLETAFRIRPSSVSNILSLMEEKGLIKRVALKNDARFRQIVLTPKGDTVQAESTEKVTVFEDTLLSTFNTDEIETFYKVIDKLYAYEEK